MTIIPTHQAATLQVPMPSQASEATQTLPAAEQAVPALTKLLTHSPLPSQVSAATQEEVGVPHEVPALAKTLAVHFPAASHALLTTQGSIDWPMGFQGRPAPPQTADRRAPQKLAWIIVSRMGLSPAEGTVTVTATITVTEGGPRLTAHGRRGRIFRTLRRVVDRRAWTVIVPRGP